MTNRKKINLLTAGIFFAVLFFVFFGHSHSAQASQLPYYLQGTFLIQVEENGQAWYVDKKNTLRHYLANDGSSFEVVKKFGLGISNKNLAKIPIAVDKRLVVIDSDGDGLDDRLERAIGTNPHNPDSDNDGYNDGLEIRHHYDPLGSGRLPIDFEFSAKLAGNFLLQVEGKGEAWYVNPRDNLRYYIGDHHDLLKLVQYLGQGISNGDIGLIADGRLVNDSLPKRIKIDVGPQQRLYYYLGDIRLGSFPVSAGKFSTPTPRGEFKIINKHPRAWSPLGLWMPYWMGLGTGRFGIHELPIWPNGYREGENHLGIPVSGGCIRLGIGPAYFMYNWAEVGTPVSIY